MIKTKREPVQARSIEKRDKIIKAGFELICKNGYHNTNTPLIAKRAGVSTGVVYSYFNDKHDILLAGLKKYRSKIFYPMLNITNITITKGNIRTYIKDIIQKYIDDNKHSKIDNEELLSIVHSDKEVASFYYMMQMSIACRFANHLIRNGFNRENLLEKVHVSLNIIDNFCHEVIHHRHANMDYSVIVDIISNNVYNILVK